MSRFAFSVALALSMAAGMSAQPWEIRSPEYVGMRVSGPLRGNIPVLLQGQQVWFSLDALQAQPKDLRVEVRHCDMDWVPTRSEFINDPFLIRGKKPIPSSAAAAGIRSYRWSYATSVPSGAGLEPFRYSGNYIASIVDLDTEETVATFRFCVAERSENALMAVRHRTLPMKIPPWSEAHQVSVTVDENTLGQEAEGTFLQLVRVVDIYKNREWSEPVRVDLNALTPATWVDGLGTPSVTFTAGEMMPGNEYRMLDIRNIEYYPASTVLRPRDGADVSRFFVSSVPDNDGTSAIATKREQADYERYEFQLWWDGGDGAAPVYVLGDFNGWTRSREWILREKSEAGRYTLTTLLKRGRYDYMYAVGDDQIALEGNSWETRNIYTALTYYSDPRLGGYDRILFVSQAGSDAAKSSQKGARR